MNNFSSNKKLKGKDLITIGIFSAIYFAINFVFMIMGGLHPIMWIMMPGFVALFTGVPYMLMTAKVQKPGAVFLMGLITGLIYFATGQFTMVILITFVIGCGLAELIRFLTKYDKFTGNALSFVCFSLGMVGSPLPIWLFRKSFFAQITKQGMAQSYISSLEVLSANWMLVVLFAAPIIGAFIGAYVAKGMFKKHFKKAGIV